MGTPKKVPLILGKSQVAFLILNSNPAASTGGATKNELVRAQGLWEGPGRRIVSLALGLLGGSWQIVTTNSCAYPTHNPLNDLVEVTPIISRVRTPDINSY